MKITKTKEVVTEEIEIKAGTYYFECHEGNYHKITLLEYDDEIGTEYFYESVENYNSPYGIRVRKDFIVDEEELPYKFSGFIREISGKKIEKEDYYKEREDILKRLNEK